MSENEDGNGRVTLAVLGVKLDALGDQIRQLTDALNSRVNDHEERLRCVERDVITHNQRLGVAQAAQAILTLVASSVAGWVGSRP